MFKSTSLDKFAILLSGVCLLHCLITPVLLTLTPLVSMTAFVEDFLFHKLLLWLVLPSSTLALFLGCRKHKQWPIVGTGALGMAILITVTVVGHDWFGLVGEKIATSIGGLILALSHYFNYKACQNTTCSDSNCATEHHH